MKNMTLMLLLVIASLLSACRKDIPADKITVGRVFVAERIKSMVFKSGSYWIYKNQSSGITDTFRVINYGLSTTDNPPCGHLSAGCSTVRSDFYGVTFTSTLRGEVVLFYQDKRIFSNIERILTYFEGTVEYYEQRSTINVAYLQYYDSLQVQDSIYYSVDKIKVGTSVVGGDSAVMYWAANRGIIKFEKQNGEIWELINGKYIGL